MFVFADILSPSLSHNVLASLFPVESRHTTTTLGLGLVIFRTLIHSVFEFTYELQTVCDNAISIRASEV